MTPRTMSAEQEALDRLMRLSPKPCSGRTAALLRAYTELDAERAAHAETLAVLEAFVFAMGLEGSLCNQPAWRDLRNSAQAAIARARDGGAK